MPAPPAYLDECVDEPLAEALRKRGFDILTALEAGNLAEPDHNQLAYATQVGRVIISYNRAHFLRLHRAAQAQDQPHAGIILLPQLPPLSRRVVRASMMLDWLAGRDHHFRLFSWGDLQQDLLRGYRIPVGTYTEADARHALGWE